MRQLLEHLKGVAYKLIEKNEEGKSKVMELCKKKKYIYIETCCNHLSYYHRHIRSIEI